MLIRLDTAYTDTRAAQLCFALGLPPQPALHARRLPAGRGAGDRDAAPAGDTTVELRLLGASHQVVVRGPGGTLSETVAYLHAGRPLPRMARGGTAPGPYRFAASVRRFTAAGLAARVAVLRARLDGDPDAVVGVFPGSEHAVTALLFEPAGRAGALGWRTWHAYPQAGELVSTRSTVRLLPPGARGEWYRPDTSRQAVPYRPVLVVDRRRSDDVPALDPCRGVAGRARAELRRVCGARR